MDATPRLIETANPGDPDGVVLVLHGGASRRGSPMVSPTQLSVLRMVPIARRIAGAARGRLAVYRLLNSVRGWDSRHTPVEDVEWALGHLAEAGRDVLIVHGSADRIADPDSSASVARRLARTANVQYVQVRGGKHAVPRPSRTRVSVLIGGQGHGS